MKASKTVLFLVIGIVVVAVLVLVWQGIVHKKQGNSVSTPAAQVSSIVGCYVARGSKVVYMLNIQNQQGSDVSGTLSFKNYQMDSSSGTFTGRYTDGILLGDYEFDAEGSHNVVQNIFKYSNGDFIRGQGALTTDGTRFLDLSDITYDAASMQHLFKHEACPSS